MFLEEDYNSTKLQMEDSRKSFCKIDIYLKTVINLSGAGLLCARPNMTSQTVYPHPVV